MAAMQEFSAEIEIDVPRERVYEYVADLTRHHEWAANTIRLERDGEGFRSYGRQLGHENRNILTIVEQTPPIRFAFESLGREGRFRHVFEVEGAAGKSHLTKRFVVLHTAAPLRLFLPLFGIAGRRNVRGDVRRIKARLEAAQA
jgi:uncharacterized protein YndB with AHSA1/START domain